MATKTRTTSWLDFEARAPELAAAGRRRTVGEDGVAIAFIATVSREGYPRMAPVCPVFCGDDLFVVAAARTPKTEDLRTRGRFALHAFLGDRDEEFQIQGRAQEVTDPDERAAVHAAIPFDGFERSDPIFRLGIERVLRVHWERVGQPDTKAVRERWIA